MPSQPEPIDAIRNPETVPALVKRGVMSAMAKVKGTSDRERFDNAFNVVLWRLTEGLKGGEKSKKDWRLKAGTLSLTKVGRDKQREREGDAQVRAKVKAFDRLVVDLRKEVERLKPS